MQKKTRNIEILIFCFYIILYITIASFHEPWLDEAQSWQIAKHATLYDILFTIPHNEGHPPLWWLILALPARLGISYEIGLKTVGGIITMVFAYMIIFKSPFPLPVRLLLPFNYFLFYQYGIIVRPYGLMGLSCLMAACHFKEKDKKPGRFVLDLILLCFTSAYGVIIAGGIAACWCFDIVKEKKQVRQVREILEDKRAVSMLFLLLTAIILVIEILPNEDTYAINQDIEGTFLDRFTALLLTCFSEGLLTSGSLFQGDSFMKVSSGWASANFASIVTGILLWICAILPSPKNTVKYLLIPTVLLCAFSAGVYINTHHIGLFLFPLLFWAWVNAEQKNSDRNVLYYKLKLCTENYHLLGKTIKILKKVLILLVLLIPVYWTVCTCTLEIEYPYSCGREIAKYLKQHNCEEQLVFSSWEEVDRNEDEHIDLNEMNPKIMFESACVLPYFESNIIDNLNTDEDNQQYLILRVPSEDDVQETLSQWGKMGVPDVLVGGVDIEALTNGRMTLSKDYTPVKMEEYHIWKGNPMYGFMFIYQRK